MSLRTNAVPSPWPFPEGLGSQIIQTPPQVNIPVVKTQNNVVSLLGSDSRVEYLENRCRGLENEIADLLSSYLQGCRNSDRSSVLYGRIHHLSESLRKLKQQLKFLRTIFPDLRAYFLDHKDLMTEECVYEGGVRGALVRILLGSPQFKEFCTLFQSVGIKGREEGYYGVLLKVIPDGKTKIGDVLSILGATPSEIHAWDLIVKQRIERRVKVGEYKGVKFGIIPRDRVKSKFF